MPKFEKTISDPQFIQARLIRKKYANDMWEIGDTLRRLARDAKEIERRMKREADTLASARETVKFVSFVPNGSIEQQIADPNYIAPRVLPDFNNVESMANNIMYLADKAAEDNTIVISEEDKAEYARIHLGIEKDLPADFNPATHFHNGELGRMPSSLINHKNKEDYETPAGGWIVNAVQEYAVPESPRTP